MILLSAVFYLFLISWDLEGGRVSFVIVLVLSVAFDTASSSVLQEGLPPGGGEIDSLSCIGSILSLVGGFSM